MQKYVRYSLIFIMMCCIMMSILPMSFELNESIMLPLIGPIFAYSYLLCIAEYIIRYNTLKSKSWLIFVISLVGGSFVGYYTYNFLYTLEPQNPIAGEWYFSIKGLEVFIVLICILIGYEIGLNIYKQKKI